MPSQGIDLAVLDPAQSAIFTSLHLPTAHAHAGSASAPESFSTAAALSNRITSLAAKIEPAIDLFADGVHKVSQYRIAAERVADRVLAYSAQNLDRRSRETQAQAAGERGVEGGGVRDVKEVLGALASVLNGR